VELANLRAERGLFCKVAVLLTPLRLRQNTGASIWRWAAFSIFSSPVSPGNLQSRNCIQNARIPNLPVYSLHIAVTSLFVGDHIKQIQNGRS
jgi:hypothetical protein